MSEYQGKKLKAESVEAGNIEDVNDHDEPMPAAKAYGPLPESVFSDEQQLRIEAALKAREIIANRKVFGNDVKSVWDVISLANWILDGWDAEGDKEDGDGAEPESPNPVNGIPFGAVVVSESGRYEWTDKGWALIDAIEDDDDDDFPDDVDHEREYPGLMPGIATGAVVVSGGDHYQWTGEGWNFLGVRGLGDDE